MLDAIGAQRVRLLESLLDPDLDSVGHCLEDDR